MKFLADMGVSLKTVAALKDAGHDVVHLRDEQLIRLPDADVLRKALVESRIVLTFDLDFGGLLAASRASLPSVVIFRLSDERPTNVSSRLLHFLAGAASDFESGAVVVVEDKRYRRRRLPIG